MIVTLNNYIIKVLDLTHSSYVSVNRKCSNDLHYCQAGRLRLRSALYFVPI